MAKKETCTCEICREIGSSNDKKPFCPPGGSVNDIFYQAPCGQRWMQFNTKYHLWQPNTEEQQRMWENDSLVDPPGDVCY